jgi:hypothetical protein
LAKEFRLVRVVKTDRGYIDMDHVLAVGEPYYDTDGLYGFDVTLAFLDRPKQMLYYARDLGLIEGKQGNTEERILWQLTKDKIEPFIKLWKGEAGA